MFLCVKIKFGAIAPNGQEPIFNFSATVCLRKQIFLENQSIHLYMV